jgi:hypothetical protein
VDYENRIYEIETDDTYTADHFPLNIDFNSYDASMGIEVSSSFEAIKSFFNQLDDGSVEIGFRILAVVTGSSDEGPEAQDAALKSGTFKLIIKDSTVVTACAGQTLKMQENYVDGTSREDNVVTY